MTDPATTRRARAGKSGKGGAKQSAARLAAPVEGVASSHPCRVRTTVHSAKVEFEAEEYTPDRDFELQVQVKSPPGGLTIIPHRRGDDGYFMLMFQPGARTV